MNVSKKKLNSALKIFKEPEWDNIPADKVEEHFTDAMSWYRNNLNNSLYKKYTIEYAKQHIKGEIDLLNLHKSKMFSSVGAYCRMIQRGAIFDQQKIDKLHQDIEHLIKTAKPLIAQQKIKDVINQAKLEQHLRDILCLIEVKIDSISQSIIKKEKYNFDALNWYNSMGMKQWETKIVIETFTPRLQEVKDAYSKKYPDLYEGYSHLGKSGIKKLLDFYTEMLNVCKNSIEEKKINRKPRKRNLDKIVSKLVYCKEFKDIGLTSIDPKSIFDKNVLITYNTKYRTLNIFYSNKETTGLSFKGKSLINIDVERSFSKKIKKPKEIKNNIKTLENYITKSKTKKSKVSCRINENILFLSIGNK
jgi:hypothetical protein